MWKFVLAVHNLGQISLINIWSAGGRRGEFCLPVRPSHRAVCPSHRGPRQPRQLPQLLHPQATSILQYQFKLLAGFYESSWLKSEASHGFGISLRRIAWVLLRKPIWLIWQSDLLPKNWFYLKSELNQSFCCRPVLRRKAKPEKRFKDKFSEEVYYDLPRTLWPKLVKLHLNPSH